MEDKEPERYYDWMLWKMRQEKARDLVEQAYTFDEKVNKQIGLDKLKELSTIKQ